jgi:CubicO group peptidase (beta-lactamase class C family)
MDRKAMLPLNLEAKMSQYRVPGIGIAVFNEGKLEWSEGDGVLEAGTNHKVKTDSIFHACSISKMVTAIGLLYLAQEGMLDLDEDVNRHLVSWRVPENQFTEQKKVTLRNLLAHQAGFVDPDGSFDIFQEQDQPPTIKDILMGKTRFNPKQLEVAYVPESQFSYSDAGYCVVEQIVEDVTGEPFASVIERLVITPLGLKNTFFWNVPTGLDSEIEAKASVGHHQNGRIVNGKRAYYPYLAAAGLWTTPSELALLTIEILKAWNGDTDSILRPDMARLMLTGYGCDEAICLGVFIPQNEEEPYMVSKGWGVGFQCMLLAYPRLQSGVIVMTNSDPGKPQNEALVGEVMSEIGKEYGWTGF